MSSTVAKITKLNITGNVIPNNWWRLVTFDSGKPDTVAVVLLSDIVYWYRATERRDEKSGLTVGYDKKFKADKLQRSYKQFSDQYGFTKRQVADAMKRLEKQGLITLEFRNMTVNGVNLNNILFVEPVAENITKITYLERNTTNVETPTLSRSNVTGGTPECYTLPRSDVTGHTLERGTNTEISQKTSTEISQTNKRAQKSRTAGVEQTVFEYWQAVHKKPRAKLTEQRRKKIRGRLKDGYTEQQILDAIAGVKLSSYHMGKNETNTVYDDLTTILRDGGQVEKFGRLANDPHAKAIATGEYSSVTARNLQNLEDWMEEENGPF